MARWNNLGLRHHLVAGAVFAWIAVVPAICLAGTKKLGSADNGRPDVVAIKRADRIEVTLPEDPTTGFSWQRASDGTKQLELHSEKVERIAPGGGAEPRVGGSVQNRIFLFRVPKGKLPTERKPTIKIIYARTDGKAVKTYTVPIRIEDSK